MKKPEKRLRTVWFAEAFLVTVIISAIITAILAFALELSLDNAIGAYGVTFGILIILSITYMTLRYRAWGFELRDDHLYIEHGVFRKVKTMVPFVRIQHVDSQRGVIERTVGLSKIIVYTAGSRGADVTVPGLLPQEAEGIQKKLRDVAIESEDRDGV